MKRFFLLCAVLAFPFICQAVDPLDGAFGLRFGDVFTPNENTPRGTVRTDEYARTQAFRFQPAAPNRLFQEYWVFITPTSHRIYRIVAVGKANNIQLAESQQEAVLTVAREKYYGDFSIHDRWVIQGTRSVSVRPPTTLADGSALWQVAYTDLGLSGRIMTANNGNYEEVDDTGL